MSCRSTAPMTPLTPVVPCRRRDRKIRNGNVLKGFDPTWTGGGATALRRRCLGPEVAHGLQRRGASRIQMEINFTFFPSKHRRKTHAIRWFHEKKVFLSEALPMFNVYLFVVVVVHDGIKNFVEDYSSSSVVVVCRLSCRLSCLQS